MKGRVWVFAVALLMAVKAEAGGPRFVTGTNFSGAAAGNIMAFYTPTPLYYTDPGDLNAKVTHAQADAMVAAAASVWNVPTSLLTLAQGGVLAEHVSEANSYFTGTAVVFPDDVLPSNYLAKPIAVIYDSDGGVTDLLLGSGASEPEACRHNGVTESVDGFGQTGTIQHAVIVLNGRCVGDAPEQMLQMQYQLERVFGRVVGLAWAQLNDNVFTGVTQVTKDQEMNWPVMHPIDVICGAYTYQCMQSPFTLRADDVSTLGLLYPVTAANLVAGKALTISANSIAIASNLYFPTLQAMDQVNVVVSWGLAGSYFNAFQTVSGVSGFGYRMDGGNPVTERTVAPANNVGGGPEGYFRIGRVPLDYSSGRINELVVATEPINALYSGEYAIGIYEGTPLSMSGSSMTEGGWLPAGNLGWGFNMISTDAASSCSPGKDGAEKAPVAVDPSGWWTGLLCGPGHVSWFSATVKAGHSWTLETTATDESGAVTERKMRPVMGVWNATDATGGLPTVAATNSAMNSMSVGMTQLGVGSAAKDTTVRIAIADMQGAGRPDFTYKARMLYADSIAPTSVGAGGGTVTITGMGFRAGNQVLVNGVKVAVVSWTSTQIVAAAPSMTDVGLSSAGAVDVAVVDASTAGQTVMSGALVYTGTPPVRVVTAVGGARYLAAGEPVTWSVSVQATQDGAPAAGVGVGWTGDGVTSAQGVTDAAGVASVGVSTNGLADGTVSVVTGCVWTSVCAGTTAYGVAAPLWTVTVQSGAGQSVAVGSALGNVVLAVTDGSGHALQGAPVTVYQTVDAWEGVCPVRGRCPAAPVLASGSSTMVSDANGLVAVTPLQVPGAPQVVNLAASTGTQGFVALSLAVSP